MPETSSVPPRVTAFLAALAQLTESERIRLMRAHCDYTIDILQAHEEELYRFLGECATLAADNMHDVRLENVELTVQTMQNPPAKAWGEVFTEVALGFALQVGILFGWEIVAAGVVATIGQRHLMKLTRATSKEFSAARSESWAIQGKLAHLRARQDAVYRLEVGGWRATLGRGGWNVQPTVLPEKPFEVPFWAIHDGTYDSVFVAQEKGDVAAELALAMAATEDNAQRMDMALRIYKNALHDATFAAKEVKKNWGEYWRDNIGNEKGGVLIGTTEDVIEGVKRNLGAAPAKQGSSSSEPFLTSELVGRYLTWTSEERLQTIESHAQLRAAFRSTSDSDLLRGDALLLHVLALGTEFLPPARTLRQHAHAARPAIVKGIEAALWREYLSANAIVPALPAKTTFISREPLKAGDVVGDYLILSGGKKFEYPAVAVAAHRAIAEDEGVHEPVEPPLTLYEHDAQLYYGTSRLPEQLAGTLFKRFVRAHLTDKARADELLPFKYQASRYDNVAIPPRDNLFGYPDPDGVRCIDEMRFMVVRFFSAPPALPSNTLGDLGFMSTVAGHEARDTLEAWSAGQVKGKAMSVDEAGEAALQATLAAEHRARTITQLDAAPEGSLLKRQLAELQFVDSLTDLNLDIQAYLLIKSGGMEAGDTPKQRSDREIALEIEIGKQTLLDNYRRLLELARANREETQRLIGLYEAAVNAVRDWQPDSGWAWYGPTQIAVPQERERE